MIFTWQLPAHGSQMELQCTGRATVSNCIEQLWFRSKWPVKPHRALDSGGRLWGPPLCFQRKPSGQTALQPSLSQGSKVAAGSPGRILKPGGGWLGQGEAMLELQESGCGEGDLERSSLGMLHVVSRRTCGTRFWPCCSANAVRGGLFNH